MEKNYQVSGSYFSFTLIMLLNIRTNKYSFVVEAIIKIWQNLLSKFKQQHNLMKQYCPSGSGSESTPKEKWQFYDSMLWILPFIGHLPQLSSDADTLNPQQVNADNTIDQSKFKKNKKSHSDT